HIFSSSSSFFFFMVLYTTEIYTLSLHDALPIYWRASLSCYIADFRIWSERTSFFSATPIYLSSARWFEMCCFGLSRMSQTTLLKDRKSTRLNSSHVKISYAVFCLKKKTITHKT